MSIWLIHEMILWLWKPWGINLRKYRTVYILRFPSFWNLLRLQIASNLAISLESWVNFAVHPAKTGHIFFGSLLLNYFTIKRIGESINARDLGLINFPPRN